MITATVRPADFVKIVAEIAHQCANDPERLLPTIERDENLRVLVHSAFAFQHVWETQGAALARERGWVRLPDGFRDALSDWRRRWRHAFCEPIDRGLAESLGEMHGTPFDPDEPRPVPRHTWRLVQSREYDADEAIEHLWLHMAQGLAAAESWLDSKAEFHETVDDEYAVEVRAGAVAIKALGEQLGGALEQRRRCPGTPLADLANLAVEQARERRRRGGLLAGGDGCLQQGERTRAQPGGEREGEVELEGIEPR